MLLECSFLKQNFGQSVVEQVVIQDIKSDILFYACSSAIYTVFEISELMNNEDMRLMNEES